MNRYDKSYFAYLIDGYFFNATMPAKTDEELFEAAKKQLIDSYQRSIARVQEMPLDTFLSERKQDFPNYKRTTREV